MMNEKIIGRSGKGKTERLLEIDRHSEGEILLRLGPPEGRPAATVVVPQDRFFEALGRTPEGASRIGGHTRARRRLKDLFIALQDDDRIYLRVGGADGRGYDFVADREDFERLLDHEPPPGTYLEDPAPRFEDLVLDPEDRLETSDHPEDLGSDREDGFLHDDEPSPEEGMKEDSEHHGEPALVLPPPSEAEGNGHPSDEAASHGVDPSIDSENRSRPYAESLGVLSWDEPLSSGEHVAGPYEYKVLPAPRRFCDLDESDVSHEAATALEILVNDMAGLGWEFYRVEAIAIESATGPLLGRIGRPAAARMRHLVVFRRAYSFSDHPEEHPDDYAEPSLED